jgi:hypothetical protein
MVDVLKQLLARDTNQAEAHTVAQKIAALLGSRAASNEEVVAGEPYCPFKVSLHTKEFHCFLFISDVSYCFSANRRPKTPWVADFRVSLKKPDRVGGAKVFAPDLSKILGVKVYRLPRCPDDAVDIAFTTGLVGVLRQIQFNRVLQFHFTPVRLDIVASLDTPEFCVGQALVFRNLVTVANREAYERNKDALG